MSIEELELELKDLKAEAYDISTKQEKLKEKISSVEEKINNIKNNEKQEVEEKEEVITETNELPPIEAKEEVQEAPVEEVKEEVPQAQEKPAPKVFSMFDDPSMYNAQTDNTSEVKEEVVASAPVEQAPAPAIEQTVEGLPDLEGEKEETVEKQVYEKIDAEEAKKIAVTSEQDTKLLNSKELAREQVFAPAPVTNEVAVEEVKSEPVLPPVVNEAPSEEVKVESQAAPLIPTVTTNEEVKQEVPVASDAAIVSPASAEVTPLVPTVEVKQESKEELEKMIADSTMKLANAKDEAEANKYNEEIKVLKQKYDAAA